MLEIVFSDSACGSLKMAQRYGKGKYHRGAISVIIRHADGSKVTKREIKAAEQAAEEKERLAWENAIPLGGNPADVYGFNLMLSIGAITENLPAGERQQVLEQLWSIYPEGREAARDLLQAAAENWQAVYTRAAAGEALRIWYSNQPDEICGLYWLLAELQQLAGKLGPVYLIQLPEAEADEKGDAVPKTSWGEVAPGEWHAYLALEKPAPPLFVSCCAAHWQALQAENAPLRAMQNGQLMSVAESFYDDYILREIAAEEEEFQEARVIGRVLGNYRLGISDCWIALRIEAMIRAGKLEVVSKTTEDMPLYHRTLKRRSQA